MAVKQASIGPKGQWVLTESNPIIEASCTRFIDPANNSNKYRWFFTITSGTNPSLLPVWFTQTGRWTNAHSESQYFNTLRNTGQIRYGGVISANSWRTLQQDPVTLHNRLVDQKRNGYTRCPLAAHQNTGRNQVVLRALLVMVGQTYTPGAAAPTPAPTPSAPPVPSTWPAPSPAVAAAVGLDVVQNARDVLGLLQKVTIIDDTTTRITVCERALIEKKIDHFDGLSIAADARKSIAALKNELSLLEVATKKLYATALEQGF